MSLVNIQNEPVADTLNRKILTNTFELVICPFKVFIFKIAILDMRQ
jgi:hypothetical protein